MSREERDRIIARLRLLSEVKSIEEFTIKDGKNTPKEAKELIFYYEKVIKLMADDISKFEDFCLDTVCDKGFGLYCKLEDCPQNYFNCVMEYYKLKANNQID